MTNRISRLKTALFANTREISLERASVWQIASQSANRSYEIPTDIFGAGRK
ncbi:hypothetical protein BHJ80_01340 [Escherichia coli]|nr:hypothetical protein BHJ80_01340 [Escherichia coli]